MDLQVILSQVLSIVGTYLPQVIAAVFVLCLFGEGLGLSIPYVLETTWLIAGYHLSRGTSSLTDALLLVAAAQAGRQLGSLIFFYLSRWTAPWLRRLTGFLHLGKLVDRSAGLLNRINIYSPFSVAMGRLIGLRVPLTMLLGANRRWRVLAAGIVISSLAFDGTYLALGTIVGTTLTLSTPYLFLFFLMGLALMYGVTYGIRRAIRLFLTRNGNHKSHPPAQRIP